MFLLFIYVIIQTYLQSMTVRLEEWRLRRRDTEEWMRHRQLPEALQQRVRRFIQYKWLTTRGVDEESILRALPIDLRRDIQRHLCLDLVRRVRSPTISYSHRIPPSKLIEIRGISFRHAELIFAKKRNMNRLTWEGGDRFVCSMFFVKFH